MRDSCLLYLGISSFERLNHQFELCKRRQLLIRLHNQTLSIIAMRVNNPDCSPVVIASSSSGPAKARAADRASIVGSTRRIPPWLRLFPFPSQSLQRSRWRFRFPKRSGTLTCRLQSIARALRPRAGHQCFSSTGPGIQTIPLPS